MINISVPSVAFPSIAAVQESATNLVDRCQHWSDATFENKYREAILTLVEGLAYLAGYLVGSVYSWLKLQVVRTVRYWQIEAIQAVPVLNGWWMPFVETAPAQHTESCCQAIAPRHSSR